MDYVESLPKDSVDLQGLECRKSGLLSRQWRQWSNRSSYAVNCHVWMLIGYFIDVAIAQDSVRVNAMNYIDRMTPLCQFI
jgi:hypothetical protein